MIAPSSTAAAQSAAAHSMQSTCIASAASQTTAGERIKELNTFLFRLAVV